MKTSITYLAVAMLLLATLPAAATNYYVDPSSPGSNQGTFTNPWKSIADVPWYVNYFHAGDTVFFKRGQQYTGTLSINSSGADGAPIVFMPYGSGNAPVFQYNVASPAEQQVYDRTIIRLSQVSYVVIDGFELTDVTVSETDHNVTANVGYGVYIYKGADGTGSHNIIKNLTISKLGAGVALDGGSYNTVTNCNIGNLRMILNTPDVMWDDFGANGIIVEGSDNTITHNQIHDCWSNSYDYQIDGGAIEMYGAVCNNKILYNTTSENLGFMEFGSGSAGQALNNVIGYNLLINNGHVFWINTNGGYGVDVRNLQFFNNNVVETHTPRLPDVRNLIGISETPSGTNVLTMKNNIFWINTSSNITDPGSRPFNGPQLIHQNNLFHMSGGSLGYTLDATEQNLNPAVSVFTDISSTDPTMWNYTLQSSSTAVNFGQYTGIAQDFYGQAVPYGGAPDAGIAENITSILPLQILWCQGYRSTKGNIIEWETNTDVADHFEIEKSTNGSNFKTIATVPYKTSSGSLTVNYQFADGDVTGDVQYYRIKAIEPGTAGFYSKVISIKNGVSAANMTVSPNPAQDYVYLRVPGSDFLNKEMLLVNMAGVVLRKETFNEGSSQAKLNVSMLPRGAYVIKLTDRNTGTTHTATFIK